MAAVKDIDRGWKAIKREFKRATPGYAVRVGVQGEKGQEQREDGLTNAQVATFHEFGTSKVPERSFLRSTFAKHRKRYIREIDAIAGVIADGEDPTADLEFLGEEMRADVLKTIKDKIPPPLSPATVARKRGEETPLIDTGQLINAISSEVVKG